jgi:hypothetical protein
MMAEEGNVHPRSDPAACSLLGVFDQRHRDAASIFKTHMALIA